MKPLRNASAPPVDGLRRPGAPPDGERAFERFLPWKNLWWWPRWKVPSFLMLHSVGEEVVDPLCPNNTVRPGELRRFIAAMRGHGYVFRTFRDAASHGDARTACLTFDDGWIDNYATLFPILAETECPATLFVTNRGDPSFPRGRWSAEDPLPPGASFLTAGMIREMAAGGLVEFGGHTAGHATLTRLSIDEARREIADNKAWLEDALGSEVVSFAYPRGGRNAAVAALLAEAGYRWAASMEKKMRPVGDDPFGIHRQIVPRGMATWKSVLLATRGRWKI